MLSLVGSLFVGTVACRFRHLLLLGRFLLMFHCLWLMVNCIVVYRFLRIGIDIFKVLTSVCHVGILGPLCQCHLLSSHLYN